MNYLDILLYLVPSILVASFLHQLAHALMAKHYGAKLKCFIPFPHLEGGKYSLGHTDWDPPKVGKVGRAVYAAPLFAYWLLIVLGVGLSLIALTIVGGLGVLMWIRGYFGLFSKDPSKLDGRKFRDHK